MQPPPWATIHSAVDKKANGRETRTTMTRTRMGGQSLAAAPTLTGRDPEAAATLGRPPCPYRMSIPSMCYSEYLVQAQVFLSVAWVVGSKVPHLFHKSPPRLFLAEDKSCSFLMLGNMRASAASHRCLRAGGGNLALPRLGGNGARVKPAALNLVTGMACHPAMDMGGDGGGQVLCQGGLGVQVLCTSLSYSRQNCKVAFAIDMLSDNHIL